MTTRDAQVDQLDALLSGKRLSRRRDVEMPVRIKAVRREFEALARDLSEGGVLLEVSHEELAGAPGAALGPAEQFDLIETHFRDSFDVQFTRQGVVVETTLVRMSVRPEAPNAVYFGCEFTHPLSEDLQSRLGVPIPHVGVPAWNKVPHLKDLPPGMPEQPMHLLVFDGANNVAGPRYMGPIVAIGGDALVLRVENTSCEDVTHGLAGRELRIQVMRGARTLWASAATLLATRFVDGPRQGAEVALSTRERPTRKVRRLLRRSAA
jgi:hypothetical protein